MTIESCTNGWLIMQSGHQFWPLDPKVEDIRIEDIAHSLAKQCRWNGHLSNINHHYSVAQHSIYVSLRVEADISRLWGLLHDATETYICDVPRPLKPMIPEYKIIEDKIAKTVIDKFNIPFDNLIDADLHRADMDLLFMERDELVSCLGPDDDPVFPFEGEHLRPIDTIYDIDPNFYPWCPSIARDKFMKRFCELTGTER